jgi:hypothetical protein
VILVDSSVGIDYFNGAPTWQADLLDKALYSVPIVLGDLILTVVLQGFRSDRDYRTAKSLLDAFTFSPMGGYDVAVRSARNFRELRKKGVTVQKRTRYLPPVRKTFSHHRESSAQDYGLAAGTFGPGLRAFGPGLRASPGAFGAGS